MKQEQPTIEKLQAEIDHVQDQLNALKNQQDSVEVIWSKCGSDGHNYKLRLDKTLRWQGTNGTWYTIGKGTVIDKLGEYAVDLYEECRKTREGIIAALEKLENGYDTDAMAILNKLL